MKNNYKKEPKIIVYKDKSVLYEKNGNYSVFKEGNQSEAAKKRFNKIKSVLEKDFLDKIYEQVTLDLEIDEQLLPEKYQKVFSKIADSVTSEEGRAVTVLTVIQLVIKAICPEQSIRLHKGNSNTKSFSWNEGISMRSIDSNFVTPFLRKYNLLKLNKYGAFMTRSLAENYPYSELYKAKIKGDMEDWKIAVDIIENEEVDATESLKYVLSLLKNRSETFKALADKAHNLVKKVANNKDFYFIESLILKIVNKSDYKARIFEVAIHSFFQSLKESNYLEGNLAPLSQMRSANKKHGNVGDVEIYSGKDLIESWDAKFGKAYLRDELEELNDKLGDQQNMEVAGFITDAEPRLDSEIVRRKEEIARNNETSVEILSFTNWINYEINSRNVENINKVGKYWILFFVDSLGQKRRKIAPIDEPTQDWIKEIIKLLEELK